MLTTWMRKKVEWEESLKPETIKLPETMDPALKELVLKERVRISIMSLLKKAFIIEFVVLAWLFISLVFLQHVLLVGGAALTLDVIGVTFYFYQKYRKIRYTFNGGIVGPSGVYHE
ncbi:hypothetical protein JK635_08145 [Neobacillus sp. YIM B02564]|uniref:Uncharacterized protein n=1 Tax=Neobacillus paridis TaxID=2803862 RepID=A0ABS1TLR1_9BACI|nr:hypothetical protein [Neobacillus paridis]MBL4952182.1 hypothetical protein [Neobacillus paridis]